MWLKRVAIKKLFNRTDQDIHFRPREPLSIIHGPNGVGKTWILRIIAASLEIDVESLKRVPFQSCLMEFNSDAGEVSLEVTPRDMEVERAPRRVYSPRSPERVQGFRYELRHAGLVTVACDVYDRSRVLVLAESAADLDLPPWHEQMPDPRAEGTNDPATHHRLLAFSRSVPVCLVEIERLAQYRERPPGLFESRSEERRPAVEICAEEIDAQIASTRLAAAALAQTLERSFPKRMVHELQRSHENNTEVMAALRELEDGNIRLVKAGLLEEGEEPPLSQGKPDEVTARVLDVWVRDAKQKLAEYDPLLQRIELLTEILNERFTGKRFRIVPGKGVQVTTLDGDPLPLTSLSSGEQHQLVLLHTLFFRAKASSIVLLDEPELSLHVLWQQAFLRDVLRIADVVGFSAIIATHSPDIVHDRWDLTVKLTH